MLMRVTARDRMCGALIAAGGHQPDHGKTHVNRTMTKRHARDRAQLVVIAHETGLITPGQRLSE
jgi:Cu/Zn superoxide dismutase